MLLKKRLPEQVDQTVAIRRAVVSDAKGIIYCMQSVMDEKIYLVGEYYMFTERGEQERLRNPDDITLVAEDGGKIVGVATLQRGSHKKNRHTGLLGIAITSGYRHQGIGTRLISEILKIATDMGIEKVNLEVFSTNANAIEAYKKLGFFIEGVKKGQFRIGSLDVDDVLMTRYSRSNN